VTDSNKDVKDNSKDSDKEFNLEKPFWSEDEKKEDATRGFGKPTKGDYSAASKGWKTFGSEGQGNEEKGLK
jgi:hypothetical protein